MCTLSVSRVQGSHEGIRASVGSYRAVEPCGGAGNQAWVLGKSSQCSQSGPLASLLPAFETGSQFSPGSLVV